MVQKYLPPDYMRFIHRIGIALALWCGVFIGFSCTSSAAILPSTISVSPSETGVVIKWRTTTVEPSRIRYGTTPELKLETGSDKLVFDHVVQLSKLSPGTQYYFHIITIPDDISKYSTFFTAASSTISDLEYQVLFLKQLIASLQRGLVPLPATPGVALARDLKLGDNGEDVKRLQRWLNSNGFIIAASGAGSKGLETTYFGPATARAVSAFQNVYRAETITPLGLAQANGIVSSFTRSKLNNLIAGEAKTRIAARTRTSGGGSSRSSGGGGGGGGGGGSSESRSSGGGGGSVAVASYTITASAGAGGSISPTGATAVSSGASQTYTITASSGYTISSVSVDGVNQGAIASYTFSNVTGDHTISATFSAVAARAAVVADAVEVSGSNECTDGRDNDADGEVDFADFGCFGPNGQETDTDYGFSRFYPTDTRIYYISNSEGNDNYTGLCPTAPVTGDCGPFKTFGAKAYNAQVTRAGYPDWFLFKRGDTWDVGAQPWSAGGSNADYATVQSGRSNTEPRLYGSYGTSMNRPRIIDGAIIGTGNVRYVAIMGLHFIKTNRSSYLDSGIRFMSGPDNVLIEDNYVQDYSANIVIEGDTQDDFVIRNNIIVDSWGYDPNSSGQERPQGLYIDRTDGVIIEGNVFDHNGWKEGVAGAQKTIYNHNVYVQGDSNNIVFRNNITARASSHGIQMRPGGEMRDNLFLDNPLAGFAAHDNPAVVRNVVVGNVVLGADGIYQPNDRGWGIDTRWDADFIGNVFAHKTCAQGEAYAMGIGMDAGKTVNLSDNVMHNWCGTLQIGGSGEGRIIITNNKFSSPSGYGFLGLYQGGVESSLIGLQFSGNSYYSNTDRNWLNIFSNAEWPAASGETNASFGPIAFTDPNRTIETYMASLGLTPTKAAFYSALREQSRFDFDARFTANAVNNYIRAGFNMPARASSQGASHAGTPSVARYTITASAGAGGSISPTGATTVSSGGAQSYVITANPGYSIASVTVDGSNLGVRSSYMFTGVTADHTISVSFRAGAGVADISGLVAHYLFDGDANDDVGSNNGTVRGGATFVPGKIGQALEFHGPCDGYCDWVLTSGPAPVTTAYTWSLWLKPIAFAGSGSGQPLLAGHGGSYSFGLNYAQGANSSMNVFQFEAPQNGGNMYRGATLTSLPPNDTWSHVAGSWDGTNLKAYLNGVLQATTPSASMNPMNGPIDIGGGIGGYAYSGAIDDILIYNRALSAEEIVTIYNNGAGIATATGTRDTGFFASVVEMFVRLWQQIDR